MSFEVRQFRASDYPLLESWWRAHDEAVPPLSCLPEDTTWLVERDGAPIVAVSVYDLKVKALAIIEHLVSDPKIPHEARRVAIDVLDQVTTSWAKSHNIAGLLAPVTKPGLMNRYRELGYVPTLKEVTLMYKGTK